MSLDENEQHRAGSLDRDPFADTELLRPAIDSDPGRSEARGKAVSNATRLDAYQPFPTEVLPFPLREFVQEGARAIGCDEAFVALPVLPVVASCIGNTRRIELKRGWQEPPVIWTGVVSESGTQKSPAFDLSLDRLRRIEQRRLKVFEAELSTYELEKVRHDAELFQWKRDPKGSPPSAPTRPVPKRLICDNITVEAMADRLKHAPRGLLMANEELSAWFGSFNQYKRGQGNDVAQWLQMHRASSITVDRKTTGPAPIAIRRGAVCMAGGIQPGVLARALTSEHFASGLAARLLVSLPPRRVRVWSEFEVGDALIDRFDGLLANLLELEFAPGDDLEPVLLRLSGSGKSEWIAFFNQLGKEQALYYGDRAAAWSKLEGYAARFALVLHLVRQVTGDETLETPDEIDGASVRAGVRLSRWFGHEAERVYEVVNETDVERDRRLLESMIDERGEITVRELRQATRKFRHDQVGAEKALEELVACGLGEWAWLPISASGGRQKKVLRLLPREGAPDVNETPAGDGTGSGFASVGNVDTRKHPTLVGSARCGSIPGAESSSGAWALSSAIRTFDPEGTRVANDNAVNGSETIAIGSPARVSLTGSSTWPSTDAWADTATAEDAFTKMALVPPADLEVWGA